MTGVIIIQGGGWEDYALGLIDDMKYKYHTYPDYSPDVQIDNRAAREMGYHERMAAEIEGHQAQGIPLGKTVV